MLPIETPTWFDDGVAASFDASQLIVIGFPFEVLPDAELKM